MANEQYIVIPGTQQRLYDGSIVILYRLPNLRWIIHNNYYSYNGRRQKGWYMSSIPSGTVMPVFNEDLVALRIVDGPGPIPPMPPIPPCPPPPGPFPPFPPGPHPPAPVPIPFTPQDKAQVDSAMITVQDLAERDIMSGDFMRNGKLVRVNDNDGMGTPEYYTWDSATSSWVLASLGYRYMTRDEIKDAISSDIIDIVWSNADGALVLTNNGGTAVDPVQLSGVAHDPSFDDETLILTVPIYGKEPFTMTIPRDKTVKDVAFVKDYDFGDHTGRAIVITVTDGEEETVIAGDASAIATDDDIEALQNKIDFGPGEDGDILVTDADGLARSSYKIGGDELDLETEDKKVATEKAVIKALSWELIE